MTGNLYYAPEDNLIRKLIPLCLALSTSAMAAELPAYQASCRVVVPTTQGNEVEPIPADVCAGFFNQKIPTKPTIAFLRKFPPNLFRWDVSFLSPPSSPQMRGEFVSAQVSLVRVDEQRDWLGGPFLSMALNKSGRKWTEQDVVLNSLVALEDAVRAIMASCAAQPACDIKNAKQRHSTRDIVQNGNAE